MQKKTRNSVFVKTRERLSGATPKAKKASGSHKKQERHFADSRDIHEDRSTRQIKTVRKARTFPHPKVS